MSKASENLIAGYFKGDRKTQALKLVADFKTVFSDLIDPTEKDTQNYFKVSPEEKKKMDDQFPNIVANPQFAPANFNFQDIADDLEDGTMLEFLANAFTSMANRCTRAKVIANAEAHRGYSKYVGFVESAVQDRVPGAVELLSQIKITSARTETAAKTRRDNKKKTQKVE